MRWAVAAATCVLALALVPQAAWAGPFDVFGFGSRAMGMGGAMTAVADDHSATYYNPAGLTLRKKIHLGADVYSALPDLHVDQKRSDPLAGPEPVSPHYGATFGVLYPVAGLLEKRLALGAAVHLPFENLLNSKYLDPRIPQWYRYDTLPDKFQFLVSAGVHVTDWLRLGAGIQFLTSVDGGANIELDLPNETMPSRSLEAELDNTAAPVAGILLTPTQTPGLQLGFTYRRELELEFGLPIVFDMGDTLGFVVGVHGVSLYTPDQFAFGAAFDLSPTLGWPVKLAADATLERWSAAPRTSLDFSVDFGGEALDIAGLDESLDFLVGSEPMPGFRDVWALRAGVEVHLSEAFAVRSGYGYRPSALVPQTGLTNIVDSDAHMVSAGLALTVADPLEIDENPVTFEVSGQATLLEDQTVTKINATDPQGDFEAGGTITTLSLSVRHDF